MGAAFYGSGWGLLDRQGPTCWNDWRLALRVALFIITADEIFVGDVGLVDYGDSYRRGDPDGRERVCLVAFAWVARVCGDGGEDWVFESLGRLGLGVRAGGVLPRRFAVDFVGAFVVAQAQEHWMAQTAVAGPLGETDLADQGRE